MHRIALALALLLMACGGTAPVAEFRAPDAPIWSAAAFQPGQIAGSWRQVAAFAARPDGCTAGEVSFTPAPGGLAVAGTLCLNGTAERVSGLARPDGPGRLSVAGQAEWWVLWVDSGYRTLAIGTPSGAFGFVLDREGVAPDRLAAAAEVFDFNGYARGAFRPF